MLSRASKKGFISVYAFCRHSPPSQLCFLDFSLMSNCLSDKVTDTLEAQHHWARKRQLRKAVTPREATLSHFRWISSPEAMCCKIDVIKLIFYNLSNDNNSSLWHAVDTPKTLFSLRLLFAGLTQPCDSNDDTIIRYRYYVSTITKHVIILAFSQL